MIRLGGRLSPSESIADRTRSLDSVTALLARPTMFKPG